MTPDGFPGLFGILVAVVLIGLAASRVTALLVQDEVFDGIRQWLWTHGFPHPSTYKREARRIGSEDVLRELDDDSIDLSMIMEPPLHGIRRKIGFILTCNSCMGVYVTGGWYLAWWLMPRGTTIAAIPFAAAGIQRYINARTPG